MVSPLFWLPAKKQHSTGSSKKLSRQPPNHPTGTTARLATVVKSVFEPGQGGKGRKKLWAVTIVLLLTNLPIALYTSLIHQVCGAPSFPLSISWTHWLLGLACWSELGAWHEGLKLWVTLKLWHDTMKITLFMDLQIDTCLMYQINMGVGVFAEISLLCPVGYIIVNPWRTSFNVCCLKWQRGGEAVMEHLAKEAREGLVERVLFLMPCHATPFYSSLHKNVSMRFLDCSPRYSLLMGEHKAFFPIWNFLTLLTLECIVQRSLLSSPKSVKLYTHRNPFPWVLFFKLLINYSDQLFDPRYGCRSAASVATFHWNV